MTAVAVPIGFAAVAFGQGSVIYPKKGQSQEQLKKDRFEWARQQTGFDPAAPSSGGAIGAMGAPLPAMAARGQPSVRPPTVVHAAGAAVTADVAVPAAPDWPACRRPVITVIRLPEMAGASAIERIPVVNRFMMDVRAEVV